MAQINLSCVWCHVSMGEVESQFTKVVGGLTLHLCYFCRELPTQADVNNAKMWIVIAKLHEQDDIWTETVNGQELSFNVGQITFMDSLGNKHMYSIQNQGWIN